jgi:N utilization substance protein B
MEEIDQLIKKNAKNWKFDRIDTIDKSILRISIYSMLYSTDIPLNVTINEAVELAKKFGGDHSGQFINGILDAIKKQKKDR